MIKNMVLPLLLFVFLIIPMGALGESMGSDSYNTSGAVTGGGGNTTIPIVGHRTDVRDYSRVRDMLEEVLHKENISPPYFRNHEFKELSSRGSDCNYLVVLRELDHSFGRHELNNGEKKMTLLFYLPNGSYATKLVRHLEET